MSETFQYDHPGSLVALRNTNGTVAESYSYDPWGRRRNPSDWSYSTVPEPVIISRGFTGHEHLDKFNLIDMNGRVYDPVMAGFLSPDPFVTNPYFSQSYNSYSYCVNNPLKFTDPSGYAQETVKMMSIFDQGQIAEFIESFIASNGDLDFAMNQVTWYSEEGYYDRDTRRLEFWITYGGPDGGAAVYDEVHGFSGTANVMTRKVSITLQPKDSYIFNNELYELKPRSIADETAGRLGLDNRERELLDMSNVEFMQEYTITTRQQINNINHLLNLYERELEIVQYKQKLMVSFYFRMGVDLLFFSTIPMNLPGIDMFKDLVFPFPEPHWKHIDK